MALGGSFGKQAYQCGSCGASTSLWSPHCPNCLQKSLNPVNPQKTLGPVGGTSTTNRERPGSQPQETGNSGAMVGGLAALLIVCGIGYAVMAPKIQNGSSQQTTVQPIEDTTPRSEVTRHVVHHASRPAIARPASVVRTHPAATASVSTPRRVAPMKLWQATKEEDE